MLSGVLHPLWPSVAVGGSAGPRGRSAALWAVWWVGGVGCSGESRDHSADASTTCTRHVLDMSSAGLSRNYYQLQLAAVSLRSPFGYTEAEINRDCA